VQIRKDESGTMAGRHNAGEYFSQLTTPWIHSWCKVAK